MTGEPAPGYRRRMARQKQSGAVGGGAEFAAIVEACREHKVGPAVLVVGDPSETRRAADTIIAALVPDEKRSFNLETYDGRTTSLAAVLASLRTPAFFPGTKLVWVRESPLFLSGAKKGDVAKAMLAAWEAGKRKDAAEKLATLVALAGWSTDKLVGTDWETATKTAIRDVFGEEGSSADPKSLQAIQTELLSRDLKLGEYRDEAVLLEEYLEAGDAGEAVLLFTAATVDGRKKIVKRIQELGGFYEFVVERERSGALTRDSVAAIVAERCASFGKKPKAAATELIVRRAGQDVAALTNELEKLCLYVGDRATIEEEDVRSVFLDMAESWIFDFTGAFTARDAAKTIPLLRGLLDRNEPPLRLLAMIAREVRMLLVARECIDARLEGVWRNGMSYGAFQTRVLPAIDEATRAAFGKGHPFALFRRFEDAARVSTARLRRALVEVAELDVRFKSSSSDPRLLLESFVLGWCRR